MRLFGYCPFAIGLIVVIAAPAFAAELKAEGNEPGLSVLIQDLKRDEANSVRLRFQLVDLWAKFAAPPENVEKITVVVPEFQPVDSGPIAR